MLTGNLDRPGGAMFPKAAAGAANTHGRPGSGRGVRLGRWGSRVRGLPESFGELPVVCLAEEIDTPGPGQVRAMVTVAGNPVLSTPNSGRLDAALAGLDFMVSVDTYVNETTRHADVIPPARGPADPSGRVELAPEPLVGDVARLEASLSRDDRDSLVLVGRRHLRDNNSWMHNLPVILKGKPRCTLQVHPDDARRLGLGDGQPAEMTSRTGRVTVPVEVTAAIRPGVVSLPHGWGHDLEGSALNVAATRPGANSNLLRDEEAFDPLSGNAVLNGIPVEVTAKAPN